MKHIAEVLPGALSHLDTDLMAQARPCSSLCSWCGTDHEPGMLRVMGDGKTMCLPGTSEQGRAGQEEWSQPEYEKAIWRQLGAWLCVLCAICTMVSIYALLQFASGKGWL